MCLVLLDWLVFESGYTNLCALKKSMPSHRSTSSPIIRIVITVFFLSYSEVYEVVSLHCFNFHFPDS